MSTAIAQIGAPNTRYPQSSNHNPTTARPKTSSSTSSRPSSRVSRPTHAPPHPNSNINPNINPNNVQTNLNQPGSSSSKSLERRQVVGQYMFGRTIGEGTFGKVKLAVHMPTGEKVAIKILEKNKIKEASDIRRVNREIKILKKSKHNNIIQLYEVFDTKSSIYLIMECAEGGEIFDFIVTHKHVNEVQSCKFFHQLVDGVNCLHHNNITHRDLKPENLLLKSSKNGWILKIVDFGLSNTHEGDKLLVTACGSPCYAAPEMIAGRKYYGPLADIWSMGVILFALVCGFLPFEDPNTAVLYKKILSGEYKPAKWISNEVKDLIRHILETDPKKRYTLNDIKRHPWYNQISEDDVPKDIISNEELEKNRNDTLIMLANAGIDPQAVLDGLASNACNSLTAMYYLSEQKIQNRLMNGGKPTSDMIRVPPDMISPNFVNNNSQIQNHPNSQKIGSSIPSGVKEITNQSQQRVISKPSVQVGDNNPTQTPRSSQVSTGSVLSSKLPPTSVINTPNPGYSIPSSRVSSTTTSKTNQVVSNISSSNSTNVPTSSSSIPKSANGTRQQSGNVVAYLQAPSLLRQFQQAKYSKGSQGLNEENPTNITDTSAPTNEIPKLGTVKKNINNNSLVPTPVVSIKGRTSNDSNKPKIPSLNLPASVINSSGNNDNSVLVSQSARQSSVTSNQKPSNVPRSARPDILSLDNNSIDINSRPNTRKNNLRSRTDEPSNDNENVNNVNLLENNMLNQKQQIYQLNVNNNSNNSNNGGILSPPPIQPLQAHGIEPQPFQKPVVASTAPTVAPTPTPQQPQAPTPSNNINQSGVRRGRNIVQASSNNQDNISIPQGLKVMER